MVVATNTHPFCVKNQTGANYFVGDIPSEFHQLTKLEYFSIEQNPYLSINMNDIFCGDIPDLVDGNQTNIFPSFPQLYYLWSDCLRTDVLCDCLY